MFAPILNCCPGDSDLKRKDDTPLENAIPSHGKGKSGVQETSGQSVKASRDGIKDRHCVMLINEKPRN